jgi:glycosyltransferase involved in cell wall biosynthesis
MTSPGENTVIQNGEVTKNGEFRPYELPHQVRPLTVVPVPDVVPPSAPARKAQPKPTVSLIIPVKNEALNIAWVLDQIPACVTEIILVDANSTDATLMIAKSARPDIRIVQQEGKGKGSALRTGFRAASGEIIVMMDADGSMAPQEITHYLHYLTNGYDYVKGSRFMGGGGSLDITRLRRLGNWALMATVKALYATQMTDLCYGFVAFHRKCLPFLELSSTGFEVETEMTLHALRAGLRIAEVPSIEMPRRHGVSNLRTFRDGQRVLRTIIREHRHGATEDQARMTQADAA